MENIKLVGIRILCPLCETLVVVRHLLDVSICVQCGKELKLTEKSRNRYWQKHLDKFKRREKMDIPLIQKEDDSDNDACQAVAAMMALKYYGIEFTKSEFYNRCESAGSGNNVLTWGVLKGVASYGLYAYLISGTPTLLIDYSEVMKNQDLTEHQAKEKVDRLIEECNQNEKTELIEFETETIIIANFIEKKAAVLIPTLDWTETENHSVVITNIWDGKVYFNNPNKNAVSEFTYAEFFRKWLNDKTDRDIIIISNKKLDFDSINNEE